MMGQHYDLTISLDPQLSRQVDRFLDIIGADTSKLKRALDQNEGATRDLKDAVDANKPKT